MLRASRCLYARPGFSQRLFLAATWGAVTARELGCRSRGSGGLGPSIMGVEVLRDAQQPANC